MSPQPITSVSVYLKWTLNSLTKVIMMRKHKYIWKVWHNALALIGCNQVQWALLDKKQSHDRVVIEIPLGMVWDTLGYDTSTLTGVWRIINFVGIGEIWKTYHLPVSYLSTSTFILCIVILHKLLIYYVQYSNGCIYNGCSKWSPIQVTRHEYKMKIL